MTFSEAQVTQWLADFLWPLFRIGGLFLMAPIFNVRQIPVRVRLLLAVMITWVVLPVLPPSQPLEAFGAEYFFVIFQQLAIGVTMGFLLQMAFAGLIFGGQVMAYSMGLGFAHMMDPQNGVQVPVVSQYYMIFGMLGFLLANGHLLLIEMIVQSFQVLPIGLEGVSRAGLWEVVSWGGYMLAGGLLLALPVVMALLLVNVSMGFIARAAPQLNIFAIGFPITLLMGMVLVWVTLAQVLGGFGELVNDAFDTAAHVITVK